MQFTIPKTPSWIVDTMAFPCYHSFKNEGGGIDISAPPGGISSYCTRRGKAVHMSLLLEIPDHVVQSMRLPALDQKQQVMKELAVALYARGILSFGKARELTKLNKIEFGLLLGRRGVPRHYTERDLEDDIAYARG